MVRFRYRQTQTGFVSFAAGKLLGHGQVQVQADSDRFSGPARFPTNLSSDIYPFGLKTTLHGKPDLKNSFLMSDLLQDAVQGEIRVQGHHVYQHLSVLHRYSTFCNENHLTLQTWPKIFLNPTLNLSNLTSKMNLLGQVFHVKWFSGQKVEYLQRIPPEN